MDFEEKTLVENEIFSGKILKLYDNEVLLPNGKTSHREIVKHNGGSAVICEKDGKILFVKQYRYAVGEFLLEIPAGKLEKGEDPKETAIRELEEEGGIKAKEAELIYEIYITPGYTSEKIYIYSVKETEETEQHLDENEFLTTIWLTRSEAESALKSGRIKDGKTVIGLLWYLLYK